MHKVSVKWLQAGMWAGTLLAAIMTVGCAGASPVGGAGRQQNVVSVTGFGEANAAPDVAFVQLGIDAADEDIGAAVARSNQSMEAIMAALDEIGIAPEDRQTSNFNVYQDVRYDEQGNPTGASVYRVNNTLNVKVRQIDQVDEVIETALSAGANQVYGLSFGIDDVTELEATARTAAIADARTRAEALAEGLGMRVGDPVYISEGFSSMPFPVLDRAEGLGGAGGAPPISQGQLTVSMNVTVSFELLPQ